MLLEVIATSVHEAVEAEAGGADRLELVAELNHGGLTPAIEIVQGVLEAVSIPVRVMIRENASMAIASAEELARLRSCVAQVSALPIDGLVLGFIKNGQIDMEATAELLAVAPSTRATFHRAFDHVAEPLRAVEGLQELCQIDRILTNGGHGSWKERRARAKAYQTAGAPRITVIFAPSGYLRRVADLSVDSGISEIHIGRAARVPETTDGVVDRTKVAVLKKLVSGQPCNTR